MTFGRYPMSRCRWGMAVMFGDEAADCVAEGTVAVVGVETLVGLGFSLRCVLHLNMQRNWSRRAYREAGRRECETRWRIGGHGWPPRRAGVLRSPESRTAPSDRP